jgi:hypothetical protein
LQDAQLITRVGELAFALLELDSEQFGTCLPHRRGLSLDHDLGQAASGNF